MADSGATTPVRTRGTRSLTPAQGGEGSVTDRILDSAELVLRGHGYAGFTTRRVAETAGIAPGNLSYHYPTKLELLRAVIKRLMATYSQRLRDALQRPGRGLEELLQWLFGEAFTAEANSLFRELWAMSLHDDVVRTAVDDFYDQVMQDVEHAVLAAYPAACPRNVRSLVQLLSMLSEGSGVIYGIRGLPDVDRDRLIEQAIQLAGVVAPELTSTAKAHAAVQT